MSRKGLEGLSALHLLCYAYGHRWLFDTNWLVKGGLVTERFRCQCDGYKFESYMGRTRVTVGRPSYNLAEGYSLGYRITREDAKQEIRRRGQNFWSELKLAA